MKSYETRPTTSRDTRSDPSERSPERSVPREILVHTGAQEPPRPPRTGRTREKDKRAQLSDVTQPPGLNRNGPSAQLLAYKQGVGGSKPPSPTIIHPRQALVESPPGPVAFSGTREQRGDRDRHGLELADGLAELHTSPRLCSGRRGGISSPSSAGRRTPPSTSARMPTGALPSPTMRYSRPAGRSGLPRGAVPRPPRATRTRSPPPASSRWRRRGLRNPRRHLSGPGVGFASSLTGVAGIRAGPARGSKNLAAGLGMYEARCGGGRVCGMKQP